MSTAPSESVDVHRQTKIRRLNQQSDGPSDNKQEKHYIFVSNDPRAVEAYSKKANTIACSPEDTQVKGYKFHTIESLEDSPRPDTVYVVHPHEKSEYILLEKYREIVFKKKVEELSKLMQRLGAREVSFSFKAGMDVRKENGGEISVQEIVGVGVNLKNLAQSVRKSERTVFPELDTQYVLRATKHKTKNVIFDLDKISEGLKFYNHQDDWKKCVELRSENWICERSLQIESRHSKEYNIATKLFDYGGSLGANYTDTPTQEGMEEYKVIFLSEDYYLKEEIYNELKEEEVDYYAMLGKVLKEGIIEALDKFEEWTPCHVVVREQGLTLGFHTKGKKKKNAVDDIMEFSSFENVVIDMLPDNARQSRDSKLFPFAVQRRNKKLQQLKSTRSGLESKAVKAEARNEVILATLNGRKMWEWASTIQWLGTKPDEEEIPSLYKPSTTSHHNKHYEDPQVLQSLLLKMFTYNNLPTKPVIHSYNSSYGDNNSETIVFFENSEHEFGRFAYAAIVGACIQVNEKCFELITSSNLYDLSSGGKEYNSILSMLCEADYSTSREYLVRSLWKQGYPKLEGYYACREAFCINLTKPLHCYGISSPTGQPVHPDDQRLCRFLRDYGDGKKDNTRLYKQLVIASNKKVTEFGSEHRKRITAFEIPQKALDWGHSYLTKLNLSNNGIFELPDELFEFANLSHLDLSLNCLFGLSYKLGNLTNLENLNIKANLITELPYSIAKLDKIIKFSCNQNPITKPPTAVWSRGIADIRNFFKDMEGGTEVNLDLRVLVLGLSEAGKTSLINGLIDPVTTALTRAGDRTVGIEKRTWVMERSEKEPVNLLTYDFAGQEEYYITHHLFLGSRVLYILAFDLNKYKASLLDQQIMLWWNSIQDRVCDVKSNDSKTPKVIIVGTHADMVKDAQGCADHIHQSLKKRFQLRLKGVNDHLKALGKELQKLDPRRRAHMNDDADIKKKKEEHELLPAPTKMQIFTKEIEEKNLRHQLECTIELPEKIHAVSSMDLRNFDKFKEQISSSLTEAGPSGKYFPQLDEELPSSWFRIRKFVRDQSTRKGRECMKLPKYFQLVSDELGINEDVVRRATRFCHELGDVLFFEKEDLVLLCPSFLIDMFKLVIRHDHKESTYWREEIMEDLHISEEKFNKGKELFLQKGELEEWLLDVLWSQLDDVILESSIKNNLIQLLETFDIATPIKHEGCTRLLIPEFQPKYLNLTWPKNKEKGEFEAQRWVCVDCNLPHGLLKRVQVRVIKKIFKRSGTNSFNLAQNQFCIADINSTVLYCASEQGSEDCPGSGISEGIRIYVRGTDKQNVMTLLTKVYSCVENTLKDFPGLIFNHYVVYTSKNGGTSFMKLEELKEKQNAGVKTIKVIPKQSAAGGKKGCDRYQQSSLLITPTSFAGEGVEVDDLLPPPLSIKVAFSNDFMFDHPMSTTGKKATCLNSTMGNQSLTPGGVGDRRHVMPSSSASSCEDHFSVARNLGKK